jgi:hypothetical protein
MINSQSPNPNNAKNKSSCERFEHWILGISDLFGNWCLQFGASRVDLRQPAFPQSKSCMISNPAA